MELGHTHAQPSPINNETHQTGLVSNRLRSGLSAPKLNIRMCVILRVHNF